MRDKYNSGPSSLETEIPGQIGCVLVTFKLRKRGYNTLFILGRFIAHIFVWTSHFTPVV